MPSLLSADEFENSLDTVRAAAAGPIEGIFGPESLTWLIWAMTCATKSGLSMPYREKTRDANEAILSRRFGTFSSPLGQRL